MERRWESYDGSVRYGLFIAIGGFAALATPVGSSAHHSIAGQYDPRAAVTVEGIVVEVLMRNPHSQMACVPNVVEKRFGATLLLTG